MVHHIGVFFEVRDAKKPPDRAPRGPHLCVDGLSEIVPQHDEACVMADEILAKTKN